MPLGAFRLNSLAKLQSAGAVNYIWDDIYYLDETDWETVEQDSGTAACGIHISEDDGTKMYLLHTNDKIYQYTLSTAYDVSSASYASKTIDLSSEGDIKEDMWMSEDGVKLFLCGRTLDTVRSYTMSTPWDISTVSYDSKSLDVSAKETAPRGIFVGDDGAELYVVGTINADIHQYTMSTPYDLATASFTATKDTSGEAVGQAHGIQFNRNGEVCIMSNGDTSKWQEYNLSTPWDISTASAGTSRTRTYEWIPTGMYITPDGKNVYGTTSPDYAYDRISQYKLTTGITMAADSFSANLELAVPYAYKLSGFSDVAPRRNAGLTTNLDWYGGSPKSRATMVAAGTAFKFADYGGCGKFDQSGSLIASYHATKYPVTFPTCASGTNSYCVEFWIKATDATTNNNWHLSSGDSGGRWLFGFNTGSTISFGNENNIGIGTSWTHIAIVLHSGTKYFYKDGVNQGAWYSGNTGFTDLHVGAFTASAGANFRGYMQDLRVYVGTHKYPSGTTFTPPTQMVSSFS